MSDFAKRASGDADAPYDHCRSLWGVAKILAELSHTQWEEGGTFYLGLEVLAKTVDQATDALDEYLCGLEEKGIISKSERIGTAEEQAEGRDNA